jgi:hypothetical protein
MSTPIINSESLDYGRKASNHSSYRFVRSAPIGGTGSTVSLGTNIIISNFEIPNNPINLSRSKLNFDITFTNATASTVQNIDALGWSLFDRVQLATRTGSVLASADNLNQFCHIMSKLRNKVSVLTENPNGSLPTGVAVPTSNATATLYPYTDIVKNNVLPVADLLRSGVSVINAGGISAGPLPVATAFGGLALANHRNCFRMDGSLISTPMLEPLSVISHTVAATSICVAYQLDLGSLYETIMSLNKTLYFGDNLILTLSWAPVQRFCWLSAFVNPTTTGTGSDGSMTIVGQATAPGGFPLVTSPINGYAQYPTTETVSVNNLYLYTAIEQNPVTISQLVRQVNENGFELIFPYVYNTRTSAPSSSSLSIQQRITRSYGSRLLRCYNMITPNASFTGTASAIQFVGDTGFAPHLNFHNSRFIGSYNTSIDQIRLQDLALSPTDGTAYLYNEYFLRGCCYITKEQYDNQFFHLDSWTDKHASDDTDDVMDGLDLASDKTYGFTALSLNATTAVNGVPFSIQAYAAGPPILAQTIIGGTPPTFTYATGSAAYTHNLWFVCQRTLMIKGNQILVQ